MPRGTTGDEYPTFGKPFIFRCPGCNTLHESVKKLNREPTRNGEFLFYTFELPPHAHSCEPYARWKEQDEAREATERQCILHSPFPAPQMHSIRERSGIPRFICGGIGDFGCSLPWVRADLHLSYKQPLMNAAREVRRWATVRSGTPRTGLWVYGGSGTGKTTLAASLAADIAFRNPVVKVTFWNFDALMEAHYANIRKKAREHPRQLDLHAMLETSDVLVLDDIGTVGSTAAPAEMLMRIAEAYYSGEGIPQHAVLLLTSNETPTELAAKLCRMKPDHPQYGDRVVRRLLKQTGTAISV